MRKTIARGLVLGATTVAATFGVLGTAPASADLCEHSVYVGPQRIGYDDPTQDAVGILYVCLEGPVTCELGGGVHVYTDSSGNLHLDPQVYMPCDGSPLL